MMMPLLRPLLPTPAPPARTALTTTTGPAANTSAGQLTLYLLGLALALGGDVGLLAADDGDEVVDNGLVLVDAGAELAPLLLAEDAVGGAVDEEDLLLLGQAALDQFGADDVDGPQLDLAGGDLQGAGNGLVGDLAVGRAGGQAGEGEEAHLAAQDVVVELLLLDEALVLLVEVVVVLEVLLGKDVEQLRVDRVRVAEGLDRRLDAQVLEVEAGGREQGQAEGAEGELLGFFRGDLLWVVAVERA